MNRPWYQEFYEFNFQDNRPDLLKGTVREVDFIENEICFDRSKHILDVGCGAGRHSLELARRGFRVTGIDLSEAQLNRARAVAKAENLRSVEWINHDARALNAYEQFQVALMMCEGAFSLMETDEMDWMILRNVARALTPGGRFIMTVPNALYILAHLPEHGSFDALTFRETFTAKGISVSGEEKEFQCNRRFYTCPEIHWLLQQSGFQRIDFFAVTKMGFERHRAPTGDHCEFGVIADK